MRIFTAVIVWIAAIAAAAGLSSAVASSIHDTPTTSHGSTSSSGSSFSSTTSSSSSASFDASNVKGTDQDSLFQGANLTKALTVARQHYGAGAEVSDFALYPGYLSMTIEQNNNQIDFYIDAQGTENATSAAGGSGGQGTFKLSDVQATAPALIAARIAAHGRVAESRLSYFVAHTDPISGRFQWLVYTLSGSAVEYFEVNGSNGARAPLFAYGNSGFVRVTG
jgi:hypothetical protein